MFSIDTDLQRRPLGLIHEHAPYAPDLATFAVAALPKPLPEIDLALLDWPMADNDTLGDCTIAGIIHAMQAADHFASQTFVYPGDEDVESVYFGLTGGQDTGLLLSTVLKQFHGPGLFGQRSGGSASVHVKNTTLVKQAIEIFDAAYVGVNLPMPAQQQFKPDGSGVWELTGTSADYDIEGGHCVVLVAYNATGPIAVTWGGTVQITWEWWLTYGSQAYAIVLPALVAHGGDGRGFSLSAIDAWLPKV